MTDLDGLIARLKQFAAADMYATDVLSRPTTKHAAASLEAADALEQMRAELAATTHAGKAWITAHDLAAEEHDALRTELAECKADAERFVWWFTVGNNERVRTLVAQEIDRVENEPDGDMVTINDWRDAIDAARAQAG